MPFNIGAPELMIIMVIVLIVFGAGKLPNVMKDLGTGVREFKKAQAGDDEEPAHSVTAHASASTANPPTANTAAPAPGEAAATTATATTPAAAPRISGAAPRA